MTGAEGYDVYTAVARCVSGCHSPYPWRWTLEVKWYRGDPCIPDHHREVQGDDLKLLAMWALWHSEHLIGTYRIKEVVDIITDISTVRARVFHLWLPSGDFTFSLYPPNANICKDIPDWVVAISGRDGTIKYRGGEERIDEGSVEMVRALVARTVYRWLAGTPGYV